jgi:hypothetical protein
MTAVANLLHHIRIGAALAKGCCDSKARKPNARFVRETDPTSANFERLLSAEHPNPAN